MEAAVGGSASFGFALGPVTGVVFITFSLAITYQKTIGPAGSSGDGLTVSVVLVVSGNVSLWGIAEMYLTLMLRISYRENGETRARGTLAVKLKICKFVTLKFRGEANYKLKDGRSTTTVTTETEVDSPELNRIKKDIKEKAEGLKGARQ